MLKHYHPRAAADGPSVELVTPKVAVSALIVADSSEPSDDDLVMRSHHQPGARLSNSEMIQALPTQLSHLLAEQQHDVTHLVARFPRLFHDVPTRTTVVKHDIDVKGARPIKQICTVR